jgi:phage gp29-like protein
MALARTLNAQFIRPLVAMNVARVSQVPVYLPDINGAVDLKSFADSVDVLARRMRIGASFVRSVTRMPEPENGEEVLLMGAQPAGDSPDATDDNELDIPVTVEGEEE